MAGAFDSAFNDAFDGGIPGGVELPALLSGAVLWPPAVSHPTKVSQRHADVVQGGGSALRVTQRHADVLQTGAPGLRVSQRHTDVIQVQTIPQRVSQRYAEVIQPDHVEPEAEFDPDVAPVGLTWVEFTAGAPLGLRTRALEP